MKKSVVVLSILSIIVSIMCINLAFTHYKLEREIYIFFEKYHQELHNRSAKVKGFEVRIINDYTNERLELTDTLNQALDYIKEYSMHHDDLVAFDLSTGAKVASSEQYNQY
jgi:hypothetical protein|tara:strand:+ start:761 stop:1093 length:333 start_codon:yes stop_codon:yes gene_type:complete